LVLHLGMSGKLNFDQKPSREKHCHFWCVFKEGGALSFIDPRRFGQLECFEDPHGDEASPIKNLGPAPFNFDLKIFKQKMAKTGRSIKDFLLDQSQIAGLGNIYVCEALFLSGIDPRKKASQKTAKAKELLKNIELVLEKGIKNSGTSFSSYRDLTNFKGLNEAQLLVFRREGLPCPSCETEIIRIKQGGRSSFLCPSCQN